MSAVSRSKSLLCGAVLMAGSIPASAAIDLGSPVTGWLPVLQGAQFDEQTGTFNDTLDLVGDNAHPLLYMQYDDNATATNSDDEVAFRIRVAGDGLGMLMGHHWILVDMGGNDIIDGAIGVYSDGNIPNPVLSARFYVRTGAGTTINNTSLVHDLVAGVTEIPLLMDVSFTFLPLDLTLDPGAVDIDLFNSAGNDYFVSFKFPWSYIEDSVAYYASTGDLAPGATISPATSLKMTLASGTNHNNFPGSSDFSGYPQQADKNQSWAAQGALSPVLSFSTDADNDGHNDLVDNCPWHANADQLNTDGLSANGDLSGDICDDDDDADGMNDTGGLGDPLDNCPLFFNPDQFDDDSDLQGNACDLDDDNDTVPDAAPDNCPLVANPDQLDADDDLVGDACEDDYDGDGVLNEAPDNCFYTPNSSQANNDTDLEGDACDLDDDNDRIEDYVDLCVPSITPGFISDGSNDNDKDGCEDAGEDADDDNDTIPDFAPDNCPLISNIQQEDHDSDLVGDGCDADDDHDGVLDVADACRFSILPFVSDNSNDADNDGCEDAVEDGDDDNDGVQDGDDSCYLSLTTGFASDSANDNDRDGCEDATEDSDDDNDTVPDAGPDNCPLRANASQADTDNDGLGDACDTDDNGKVKTATEGSGSIGVLFIIVLACGLIRRLWFVRKLKALVGRPGR